MTYYNECWILNSYSKLNSGSKYTITSTPNTQIRIIYLHRTFNIVTGGKNEYIYLKPDTYILHLTLYLGILSFDSCNRGKWVLSFQDKLSVINCVEILRRNGINVVDIQKLASKRIHLNSTIIKLLTNAEFPYFVAKVENAMKKNKYI